MVPMIVPRRIALALSLISLLLPAGRGASCSGWKAAAAGADGRPRFLGPEELTPPGGLIALASYPRSGNSMVRAVIESMTGVWTGSDFRHMASQEGCNRLQGGASCTPTARWLVFGLALCL